MIERYTLPEMGRIWEDKFKFDTWLKIEILACEARAEMGEIPTKDVDVIKAKANFNVNKIFSRLFNLDKEIVYKGLDIEIIRPAELAINEFKNILQNE